MLSEYQKEAIWLSINTDSDLERDIQDYADTGDYGSVLDNFMDALKDSNELLDIIVKLSNAERTEAADMLLDFRKRWCRAENERRYDRAVEA